MTIFSATLEESQLRLCVFGTQVGDRDSHPRQGEKEVDSSFATELCRLPGRQPAELIELRGKEKACLLVEFVAAEAHAEKDVVAVLDGQVVMHGVLRRSIVEGTRFPGEILPGLILVFNERRTLFRLSGKLMTPCRNLPA
jgi:hypothetical protein